MSYVDGFVLVVPKDKVDQYVEMAKLGCEVWKKHGALEYFECMGGGVDSDSNMVPEEASSFRTLVNASEDETVWLSFIVFKSKEHRDEVNAKVMADPQMDPSQWEGKEMPFDMNRLCYGGFKALVE